MYIFWKTLGLKHKGGLKEGQEAVISLISTLRMYSFPLLWGNGFKHCKHYVGYHDTSL